MAAARTVEVDPFFGGFILETLTVGMYGESRNAIREYVQNGFDSIRAAITEHGLLKEGEGLIKIVMHGDGDGLTFRDNGAGLSTQNAVDVLTAIGASGKSHRSDAGFRGIGRLAGIVFSSTVTFTTRAAGEDEKTVVVFHADRMRDLMSPRRGTRLEARTVMTESVAAKIVPVEAADPPHFFEVKLEGLQNAPAECTEIRLLSSFVSQVGPVPYPKDFPFRQRLRESEAKSGIAIEEVKIIVQEGEGPPVELYKLYDKNYEVQDAGMVELSDCLIRADEHKRWWLWVGLKEESGSYIEPAVSGLRVRIKNIQIDGTDIFREVFQKHAKSYVRFPDWYVGEIFVAAGALVPNARRDNFEEDSAWRDVRADLGAVARELGSDAYAISNQGQLTLEKLTERTDNVVAALTSARNGGFRSDVRLIEISAEVTKLQKRVASASRDADVTTLSALQAVGSELADVKTEAIRALTKGEPKVDVEQLEFDARQEMLREVWTTLQRGLKPECLAQALKSLTEEYGEDFA